MIKAALLLTVICSTSYFYLEFENSKNPDNFKARNKEINNSKKLYAEKNLHESFERILDKQKKHEIANHRQITSHDLPPSETQELDNQFEDPPYESMVINSEEFDIKAFEKMNSSDKISSINNLKYEIMKETHQAENLMSDQFQGLRISDGEIEALKINITKKSELLKSLSYQDQTNYKD